MTTFNKRVLANKFHIYVITTKHKEKQKKKVNL